jgi:hypothetical protein
VPFLSGSCPWLWMKQKKNTWNESVAGRANYHLLGAREIWGEEDWILRNSHGLPFGTRNTMKEKTKGMKKQKTKGSYLRSKLLHRNDLGIPKEEKHILACKQKGSRQIKWSCKFNHLVNIFLRTRSIDQRKIWEDK